jgi:deazaflavin-dependent oxidoreductase (nitroreductase family)
VAQIPHMAIVAEARAPQVPRAPLPYGPALAALLRPIQRGFLVVNGLLVAPALRVGLGVAIGTPLTGHLMLLRTTGRRTHRRREVPLGYVIRDGAIWCVAGYGASTPWFRNLTDDPQVDVILPGRRYEALATPVTDDRVWLAAYRALVSSFGLVGRLVVGDVERMSDAEVLGRYRSLPVVRIVPMHSARIEAGRWDEGWSGAAVIAVVLGLVVGVIGGVRARLRGGLRARARPWGFRR